MCQSSLVSDVCSNKLKQSVEPSNDGEISILYFFSDDDYKSDRTLALASYNGVIVKYKFSNKVHHTEDKITFVDLKKGDLRITAEYKVDLITEPYKLIALKQSGDF